MAPDDLMGDDRHRCEVFRGADGRWRVRGMDRDGRIIFAPREAFSRKWRAKRSARRRMPGWPITVAK